jgi:hypothetical protein
MAKGRRMVLASSRPLMTGLPELVCVDDLLVLTNITSDELALSLLLQCRVCRPK